MKLNRIGDAELKLLCDAMATKQPVEGGPQEANSLEAKSSQAPPRRPLLRVVK